MHRTRHSLRWLSLAGIAALSLPSCESAAPSPKPEGPLARQLEAAASASREKIPPEAMQLIERANRELEDSGVLKSALRVGGTAPDFVLPDASGVDVTLKRLLAEGPVVLTFYRGHW